MKCKKCNNEIMKGWKYCPVCSEPYINKKYNVYITLLFIIVFGLASIIFYTTYNSPEIRTKRYIEKIYNTKIDDIVLLKTVKNPDSDISCDGTYFGTEKGKGNTEYYKAYSSKEGIEFMIIYDTYKKEYEDEYLQNIRFKKYIPELYEKTKNTFENYTNKTIFLYNSLKENEVPITVNSKQDLDNVLSNTVTKNNEIFDNDIFTSLRMFINMNSFEFCKKEYKNIKAINDYLKEIQTTSKLYSGLAFTIITSDNVSIVFNRLEEVRIYDKYANDKAWGETIEDFIKRDSY